jgi:hypothetical protein
VPLGSFGLGAGAFLAAARFGAAFRLLWTTDLDAGFLVVGFRAMANISGALDKQ